MWELYKDVLWLIVLCIAGIAACLTGIGFIVFYNRKDFSRKLKRRLQNQTEHEQQTPAPSRRPPRDSEVFVIDLDD